MATLSPQRIEEIERIAEGLFEEANMDDPKLPVAVDKIAEMYGISVELVDSFPDLESKHPKELISGCFDQKERKIRIAANDYYSRQAFTAAHELGHFILEHNLKEGKEVLLRTDVLSVGKKHEKIETEANWFAASLLMPRFLVFKYWEKTKDIETLSKLFGVSRTSMRYRLSDLGLLSNNGNSN